MRLDPDAYRDLQTEALARGISLAEAIRRALRAYVAAWRGEAREQVPAYGTTAEERGPSVGGPIVGLAVARLRGTELVLPAPEGLPPDATVLVSVVGPVTEEQLDAVRTHKARLDDWARRLADIPDDPVGLSDDDRDIYR